MKACHEGPLRKRTIDMTPREHLSYSTTPIQRVYGKIGPGLENSH
jgi:hypothetical protein